jgi:glutamate N-acetyltransferase/amino-acid N-acetyltransferase
LPFSTGVIGEPLPLSPIENALPDLFAGLDEGAWPQAARAIMTTDTKPKLVSRQLMLQGTEVNVTGIAKGAGMICPNMATMLAFVATDAALPQALLQKALEAAVAPSFNSISVDGDTSTNDACVLMATGQSGLDISDLRTPEGRAFSEALLEICMGLARAIILDAEGATKLLDIEVSGARTPAEAKEVAYPLAHSPLVKTAMFASDPNWGRILAAVGRAPVAGLEAERVSIHLGEVPIVTAGARDPNYQEAMGQAVVAKAEIPIRVHLGMGDASARVLSCDLSFDYVKINAEYRS